MKMQTQIELLNIIGCLVLFENDIYKIDRVTRCFIYAYKYKTKNKLILNDAVTFYPGESHTYNCFLNELEKKTTKIKIGIFIYNYTILGSNIDIDNIFIFNNTVLDTYKDSLLCNNIELLKTIYVIRFFIRSLITREMNKNTKYYKDIKNEFINKLNNYFEYFKIDNIKYVLDEASNYSKSFLSEPYIDYNEEYLNISNMY